MRLLQRIGLQAFPLACWLAAGTAGAQMMNSDLYAILLDRYTREVPDVAGTRVDYAGLQHSREWQTLIEELEGFDSERLQTREQRLAFWINAYNILAIDLVRRNDSVDSIRDLGSLFAPIWDKEAGRIGERPYSLREIENEILRPMGDPRIHAAIVCASTSCPSLRREPYVASKLHAQLDDALRRFLANPHKGLRVDQRREILHLSKVFDWFESDYAPAGGVLRFVLPYMPDDALAFVQRIGSDIRVSYLEYDWTLNDLDRGHAGRAQEESSRASSPPDPWTAPSTSSGLRQARPGLGSEQHLGKSE